MIIESGDPKESIDETEIDETEFGDNEFEAEADIGDGTTVVLDETGILTDNVGDVSVEINVEEIIADIEASEDEDAHRKKEIRRRLEEMAEEKSHEDTYAIDVDDESEAK
jgi:hypothetical protein